MVRWWLAAALVSWMTVPPASAGEAFQGQCARVIDGNTVAVTKADGEVEVRLAGIEAPDLEQAFGAESRRYAADLTLAKTLIVEVQGTDPFGRTVGRVRVGPLDAGLEMVKAGLAWYSDQPPSDGALAAAQAEAQASRRGLWADPNPVPPWKWRSQHPRDSRKALADLASKIHIRHDADGLPGVSLPSVPPERPAPTETPATPPHR